LNNDESFSFKKQKNVTLHKRACLNFDPSICVSIVVLTVIV